MPDTIALWAKEYIGIPFLSGGRTRDGCDCYGLVRLVWMEQCGYKMPLLSDMYEDALNMQQTSPLVTSLRPMLAGEKKLTPEPLDLAVILNRGLPTHLAVYAGGGYILHTIRSVGTVLQRISDRDLANRIEGFYGIKTADTDSSVPDNIR